MEYEPILGLEVDLTDMPRALTEEELEYITEVLPKPLAADEFTRETVHKACKKHITNILKIKKLAPSQINALRDEIYRQYTKSLVSAGESVGIRLAEALSTTATQSSLDAFHTTGRLTQTVGDVLENLLLARHKPLDPSSQIYFKGKELRHTDYVETLERRRELVEITVGSLIVDYDLEETNSIQHWSWEDRYKKLNGITYTPEHDRVLRIYLDRTRMYNHRIPLDKIVKIIQDAEKSVNVVPSPTFIRDPYIDIYPTAKFRESYQDLKQIPIGIASLNFLKTTVLTLIDQLRIQGVEGIRQITPVKEPVWSAILHEIQLTEEEFDELNSLEESKETGGLEGSASEYYYLVFNLRNMRRHGIRIEEVMDLLELCKVQVVAMDASTSEDDRYGIPDFVADFELSTELRNYLIVRMPEESKKEENGEIVQLKPGVYINGLINKELQKKKERKRELEREGKRFTQVETSKLERVAFIYRARSSDTKNHLYDLLGLNFVDKTLTISNNIHEVVEVLGVGAARNLFLEQINFVTGASGVNINPAHLTLTADFMFGRGRFIDITYVGISNQPVGPLARATFARPLTVLQKEAIHGTVEPASSVAFAIATGQKVEIGTYSIDVKFSEEDKERFLKELKNKQMNKRKAGVRQTTISSEQIKQGMDELSRLLSEGNVPTVKPTPSEIEIFSGRVQPELPQDKDFATLENCDGLFIRIDNLGKNVGPIRTQHKMNIPPAEHVPTLFGKVAKDMRIHMPIIQTLLPENAERASTQEIKRVFSFDNALPTLEEAKNFSMQIIGTGLPMTVLSILGIEGRRERIEEEQRIRDERIEEEQRIRDERIEEEQRIRDERIEEEQRIREEGKGKERIREERQEEIKEIALGMEVAKKKRETPQKGIRLIDTSSLYKMLTSNK